MPLPLQYKLQMTDNWDEFEDIVTDCMKMKYGYAQKYGRSGQKQNGIDILASTSDNKYIGVQCKNYVIGEKDIDNIIKELDGITIPIQKFVIAIGAKRDNKIQEYIILKYGNGISKELLFWDEIEDMIASDNKLLEKYYPQKVYLANEVTLETLVNDFNDGIQKCGIIQILHNNPIEGMPRDYATDMCIFCHEMEKKLNEATFAN